MTTCGHHAMRSCSWSPACRQPAKGEWCSTHGAIMLPLFRPIARGGARRPRAVHDALLSQLDDDRAQTIARHVGSADKPVQLDGRSDALQRAVTTATAAGWITPTRNGFIPGSVAIGSHRAEVEPPAQPQAEAIQPPGDGRRVEMIRSYIERRDKPPMKAEIMRDLNLTIGTATHALQAGRERGVFHVPHSGSRAYHLGPCPPPRDLGRELSDYVRRTGGTNAREAANALDMVPGEMARAIRLAVAAGSVVSSRGRGRTILPTAA